MTDHTTAAQAAPHEAVLTDGEILQVFADVVGNQEDDARFIDVDRDQAIRIARTLLSKLRAPVADERAAFEAWMVSQSLGVERDGDSYSLTYARRAWDAWEARAALASAPVAGDGKTRVPGDQLGGPVVAWDDGALSTPNRSESRASIESKGGALAPVAGEALVRYCPGCGSVGPVEEKYRDCCPDGNQARMIPARLAEQCHDTFRIAIKVLLADAAANDSGAPQASEAVCIQVLAALEAAQRFIRNGVEFGYIRMPGADTPDPAHQTPGLIDAAIRALSAQPGAQKEQSDA